MDTSLALGVVRYLNAQPLFESLRRRAGIVLVEDVPARLVERFRTGELDAAILPVLAYFAGTGDSFIRGLGIASRGASDSVRLFCRKPLREIESVLLDVESVTSNALCRILLHQALGLFPRLIVPTAEEPAPPVDAVLHIGDRGMRAGSGESEIVDLGEVWYRWTGLPFVFAGWVVRPGLSDPSILSLLHQALYDGASRLGEIAERGARESGLDRTLCERYLRERIRYRLGPEEEEGLARFAQKAYREGLISFVRPVRYFAP